MDPIFVQSPPKLGNQYLDDPLLGEFLDRTLPPGVRREIDPQLDELGRLAGGELYELQLADRLSEPRLVQWDAWGNRVDRVELTPLWTRCARLAAEHGLVAIPYEQRHGWQSRVHQFAAVYLFHPSSDVYTCPLAMSDGAARTLLDVGDGALVARAVSRLTSRDPAWAWTSGQWMTEASGGSDVGKSQTEAAPQPDGSWRLYGKKWFTSAVTSEMALALARPAGRGPGGRHLALFYIEVRDHDGTLNGIRVERLKDKLGTRKVPTAELLLDGTVAALVGEPRHGTQAIEPMLAVTRAWNSISAVSFMRRGLALARAYAHERSAFGRRLAELPLHVDTLDGLEAETRGAFLLAFELVGLMGRREADEITADQRALLRLLTPIAKLLTAKQAVAVMSEVVESFGGAGYVEDTGLPLLLRDAHVLPIWEGTTNVLALDALLRSHLARGLEAWQRRVDECLQSVRHDALAASGRVARTAVEHVAAVVRAAGDDVSSLQSEARRIAVTLGRALELALLVEHAQWVIDHRDAGSGVDIARRFASHGVDALDRSAWLASPEPAGSSRST